MVESNKFIKAGISANVALVLTYPIDIYKIKKQSITNIQNKNWLSYYRGILPVMPLTFIEKGIKIYTYDYFKSQFNPNKFSYQAAILSGLSQGIFTTSTDILKIRNQVNNYKIPLYRGLHLTWARDVPFNLIFFGISDNYNNSYSKFIGSFLATSIVTPIDVIKTRYSETTNTTLIKTIKNMKFKDYTRGFTPRVLSVGLFYGITYNLYLYI